MVSLLPGYEAQMSEDGVAHSRDKLRSSLDSFLSVAPHPSTTTLLPSTSEESHSYRAACGFQIIRESELPSSPPSPSHDPLVYCMRNDFRPVSLQSKVFSIANPRIQVSMELTIDFLNSLPPSHPFLEHLTSCKFVTSWDEKECFLTLSYGDAVSDSAVWEERGAELAGLAGLTAVTARFKKTKLVVGSPDTVHDTIVVEGVPIVYEKPEDAFQHPNPCTMHKALVWMFEQMRAVAAAHPRRALNLLEMYCGCGAHTMALGKVGGPALWSKIVAVELDARLVDCCSRNISTNGLSAFVSCTKGDAGSVSKRIMRRRARLEAGGGGAAGVRPDEIADTPFDVMLVDPPRAGLDEAVINLAKTGGIEHLLYVSCGRHALVRDLGLLGDCFEVSNILLTDLFPRTDSVETLVHLKRKGTVT
ncbi:hypothetical protein TeGR_g7590 [Tetraparma gracilis]|uniref:S-adenosyl-L-methionine-dependent methyltransferase n=1 Tax=Tetraparma gracilis TaxID=2962635 RepID=A0ABQ6M9C7_9STRA|nr:hypothetical protein TeGR_g7590 [Tetraparma gracilis]